ncbi:MAG: RNA polymerase factor sigma-54 [Rhodospirillales bacterium]
MALMPRLDLRQTQSLVMTPQLQQAIKLLQLSSLELQAFVDTQLEQNPLLERDEAAADHYGIDDVHAPAEASTADGGDPKALDAAVSDGADTFTDSDLDLDFRENLFDGDGGEEAFVAGLSPTGAEGANRGGSFDSYDGNSEESLSSPPSLHDHLLGQLALGIDDPVDRIIAVHLIDMLDDAGYLVGDLAQLAALLGCPVERIEATLLCLQSFDPPGIFARSLAECLALQLEDRGRLDAPMQTLLQNLELVARCDWAMLSRLTGLNSEEIGRRVTEIRTLNPKPALAFDYAIPQPVVPDVIMRAQPNGGWIVELNSETLPRVLVNNTYYTQISRMVKKREDRQYISDCLQTANWLVKSLHQRATTILKVATEIIRQQQDFFVAGVQALRPLVLRDIAEVIGMHESTVSRVTSNKYVATPRGIYELKYFFTHAVGGSRGGDTHSAVSVRHRIKVLIDAEPAHNVLSDDGLADVLQKEGIDIARRTVAKYREALGIPSSVQRRRQKGEGP